MHDPLVELAPAPPIPFHPVIAAARTDLLASLGDVLAIPDGALEGPWRWRPADEIDTDVRYGIYRLHERLEEAIAAIERGRAGAPTAAASGGPAVPPLAAATEARWDLHGVLLPLGPAELDEPPGGGEWTVRRTLGHVITSQRSYGWFSAWFLHRAGQPDAGEYPPDGTLPPDGDEEEDGQGSPEEVRARLDGLVDEAIEAYAGIDAGQLAVAGRWSGLPVTVDFRMGRLGSHIREHTVQVDKTLAMLGRVPTEAERLARLVAATYGRLEGLVIGRAAAELDRPLAGGASAAAILASATQALSASAASVRAAAASAAASQT
jgi:hypothetical protein